MVLVGMEKRLGWDFNDPVLIFVESEHTVGVVMFPHEVFRGLSATCIVKALDQVTEAYLVNDLVTLIRNCSHEGDCKKC